MKREAIIGCILMCGLCLAHSTARSAGEEGSEEMGRSHLGSLVFKLNYGPNYNQMGDWSAGLNQIGDIASGRGLQVWKIDDSGVGGSGQLSILLRAGSSFLVGAEIGVITDRNSLSVLTNDCGFAHRPCIGRTTATATSTTILFNGAYYPYLRSRQFRPYLGGGLGYGSGKLTYRSRDTDATGSGGGVVATVLAGFEIDVVDLSAGYRFHSFDLDYSQFDFRTPDPVTGIGDIYWFSTESEARAFLEGRAVDVSGWFMRFGVVIHIHDQ